VPVLVQNCLKCGPSLPEEWGYGCDMISWRWLRDWHTAAVWDQLHVARPWPKNATFEILHFYEYLAHQPSGRVGTVPMDFPEYPDNLLISQLIAHN
jgi:hypothetical protein